MKAKVLRSVVLTGADGTALQGEINDWFRDSAGQREFVSLIHLDGWAVLIIYTGGE